MYNIKFKEKSFSLELSKNITTLLKGLCIFIIISHNFWHNIAPAPGENEMFFSPAYVENLLHLIEQKPTRILQTLVSFYGFYPVYIFLFISGYGLAQKRINNQNTAFCSPLQEIKECYCIVLHSVIKLVKLCVAGALITALIRIFQGIPIGIDYVKDFFVFLTFTNNLRSDSLYDFITVWWYLSLAIQSYILFPIYYLSIKKYPQVVLSFCLILTCLAGILTPWASSNYGIWLFSTPLAQSIVFAYGIYISIYKKIYVWQLPIAIVVFIFGSFFQPINSFIYFSFLFYFI